MADIERVITGLRFCSEKPEWNCDKKCPYGENGKKEDGACWVELNRDALSVIEGLKAELAELKDRHETIVKAADDMLAELKERRWIPVSERLPQEKETILAKLKGTSKWRSSMFEKMSDDVRVVVVFPDGTRRVSHSHTVDGKWECEKSPVKRTVTHWMQNPELPKDGDEK